MVWVQSLAWKSPHAAFLEGKAKKKKERKKKKKKKKKKKNEKRDRKDFQTKLYLC